jgi:uncharacterized protein (TIGR03067 family)
MIRNWPMLLPLLAIFAVLCAHLPPGVAEPVTAEEPQPSASAEVARAIQGRWLLESFEQDGKLFKREDDSERFKQYANLTIDERRFHFPEINDASRRTWQFRIDAEAEPKRVTLTSGDDVVHGTLRGILWCGDLSRIPEQFTVQLAEVGGDFPSQFDTKETTDLKLNYRRDPEDPLWLRVEAQRLREIADELLAEGNDTQQRFARGLLESADSMRREAKLREQAAAFLAEAEAHKDEPTASAKARAEAQAALAQAATEAVHRQQRQRQMELEGRERDKVNELVARAAALREEGRFDEAAEIDFQMRQILRGHDPDVKRINELKRRATEARLEGRHTEADDLDQQAAELLEVVKRRYQRPDDVYRALGAAMAGAGQNGGGSTPSAVVKTRDAEIRMFNLENIDAAEAYEVLLQLGFREAGCLLSTSQRLNALIAQGPHDELQKIEALLRQLDAKAAGGRSRIDDKQGAVQTLEAEYQAAQRQAESNAKRWREENSKAKPDGKRLGDLAEQTKRDLQNAFQLRQQMHRARIADAQRQLDRIEQRVRRREALAEEIVQRRLEELLRPELRWEDAAQAGKVAPATPAVEGLVTDIDPENALVQISLGSDDGIRPRMQLDVYRNRTYVGRIEVVVLKADHAVARLVEATEATPVRKGDWVTTQLGSLSAQGEIR